MWEGKVAKKFDSSEGGGQGKGVKRGNPFSFWKLGAFSHAPANQHPSIKQTNNHTHNTYNTIIRT